MKRILISSLLFFQFTFLYSQEKSVSGYKKGDTSLIAYITKGLLNEVVNTDITSDIFIFPEIIFKKNKIKEIRFINNSKVQFQESLIKLIEATDGQWDRKEKRVKSLIIPIFIIMDKEDNRKIITNSEVVQKDYFIKDAYARKCIFTNPIVILKFGYSWQLK